MLYRLAADALVLVHLAFILFVLFGAFLALRWRWVLWLHIPTVTWGILVEINQWICPLTPWEQQLRDLGGEQGYEGGFIDHYLVPLIYPQNLDALQYWLVGILLAVNLLAYGLLIRQAWRQNKTGP